MLAPPPDIMSAIDAAAKRHGVETALLVAVAEVESGFNPDVISGRRVSKAGALGLFQFMPETAHSYGIDPLDPAQAADGAARHLKYLFKVFASWPLAIAAYNTGEGYIRRHPDPSTWNPETAAYVPKVYRLWDGSEPPFIRPPSKGAAHG